MVALRLSAMTSSPEIAAAHASFVEPVGDVEQGEA